MLPHHVPIADVPLVCECEIWKDVKSVWITTWAHPICHSDKTPWQCVFPRQHFDLNWPRASVDTFHVHCTHHLCVCVCVSLAGSTEVVQPHFLSRSAHVLFTFQTQTCTHVQSRVEWIAPYVLNKHAWALRCTVVMDRDTYVNNDEDTQKHILTHW